MDVDNIGAEWVDAVKQVGQYAILVNGEPVALMSLQPGTMAKIQQRTGLRFNQIMQDPAARIDVLADLVDAAFVKAGLPAPGLDDAESVFALLVQIPADLPEPLPVEEPGEPDPTSAS